MNTLANFIRPQPTPSVFGGLAVTPPVIVSYPNTRGTFLNYSVEQVNHYFRRYRGGVVDFFCEGIRCALQDDLIGFMDASCEVFQQAVQPLMDCNALSMQQWDKEYRHFRQMVLELWRYVRSSLHAFFEFDQYTNITTLYRSVEKDQVVLCITVI